MLEQEQKLIDQIVQEDSTESKEQLILLFVQVRLTVLLDLMQLLFAQLESIDPLKQQLH